ncbi:MAG: ADP-ribosylglycohydrolase family protein [Spirulina sp. SIO3F2]|nr:ADP-ribosylglycohydrolase family protein [Spirulina sp. SIO3F2]
MVAIAPQQHKQDQLVGSLLGTAVGDALGLPYEGLSPRRGRRLLGQPNQYHFCLGWGMVSDDTEHTYMVAQALIASGGDPQRFQRQLAWRFRFWLLSLPGGVGLATLKAIARLWCGFSPRQSGVFSAGNGPAMRAAILGVAIADPELLRRFVSISSRITHTDPKAEYGAFAIALAAQMVCQNNGSISGADFLEQLRVCLEPEAQPLITLLHAVVESVAQQESTPEFAVRMGWGKGVSGYVYQSVPVAIHAWLSYPQNFAEAIQAAIACGGDTDSVAAMVGGIVGAAMGKAKIPQRWLTRLMEPFCTVGWLENLGRQLDESFQFAIPQRPISILWPALLCRNLFFVALVFGHGFRRLLPPY